MGRSLSSVSSFRAPTPEAFDSCLKDMAAVRCFQGVGQESGFGRVGDRPAVDQVLLSLATINF